MWTIKRERGKEKWTEAIWKFKQAAEDHAAHIRSITVSITTSIPNVGVSPPTHSEDNQGQAALPSDLSAAKRYTGPLSWLDVEVSAENMRHSYVLYPFPVARQLLVEHPNKAAAYLDWIFAKPRDIDA